MASLSQSVSLLRQLRSVAGRRNFASTSLLSARDGTGDVPKPDSIQDRKQLPRKDNGDNAAEVSEDVFEPIHSLRDVKNADTENSTMTSGSAPIPSTRTKTTPQKSRSNASTSTDPSSSRFPTPEEDPSGTFPAIRFDDMALSSFPPLLNKAHRVFDNADRLVAPPSGRNKHGFSYTRWNNPFPGKEYFPESKDKAKDSSKLHAVDESSNTDNEAILDRVPLTQAEYSRLHIHVIDRRFVQQQTGKGKIQSQSVLTVVGNGNGLVGMANQKHTESTLAIRRSLQQAIRAMEYIERFENRTIHRAMVGRFSATTVYLRPRPPGFGLRCPTAVHAIARSAGISDLSAKIIGSTHPINVCRAVLSALSSSSGPHGMGDGIGGSGRRIDKGQGAKTIEDLEIERGRRFRIL